MRSRVEWWIFKPIGIPINTQIYSSLFHTSFSTCSFFSTRTHLHTGPQKLIPLITDLYKEQDNSTGGPPQALFLLLLLNQRARNGRHKTRDEHANVWKHNGSQPEGKDRGLQSESRLGNQLEHLGFAYRHLMRYHIVVYVPILECSEQRGKRGG